MEKLNEKQKKGLIIIVGIILLAIIVGIIINSMQSGNKKLNLLLELGEKYLVDSDYESAIVTFDEAIAIDPKCEQAYYGKAKAQYNLGLYQDAIDTLNEGIKNVDDSLRLEDFLNRILNEISQLSNSGESNGESEKEEVVIEEPALAQTSILLNYTEIIRYTNTENPTIQLEVLNDDIPLSQLTWESSDTECATVSDEGLVTCQSNQGYARIIVSDGSRYASCTVRTCEPDKYYSEEESDTITVVAWNDKEYKQRYAKIILTKNDDKEEMGTLDNLISYTDYIYYSGDVEIPEQLSFNGINIPITSISGIAFKWCNELETINIPYSVEDVGGYYYHVDGSEQHYNPFVYCDNLERINVDDDNEFLKSIDGVLYSKDGKTLIAYPANKEGKSYTIPKDVEEIYIGALSGCKNLENIDVEDGNTSYESIDGVLIDKQNNELFAYPVGRNQDSYSTPDGIATITENAFYNCNFKTVECSSSVVNIGEYAFFNCKNLEEISGLEHAKYIYEDMFIGCTNLKKIGGGSGTVDIFMCIYDYKDDSKQVVELTNLKEMINLERMKIFSNSIQNYDDLKYLTNLNDLYIDINGEDLNLKVVSDLKNLKNIQLHGIDKLQDLSWINDLDGWEVSSSDDYNIYLERINEDS